MKINNIISKLYESFQVYQDILLSEQACLKINDMNKLDQLTAEKSSLLDTIATQINQLREHDHHNHASISEILNKIKTSQPHVKALCDKLLEFTIKCSELHLINSQIIHANLSSNKQILNILQGNLSNNETYTKSGSVSNQLSSTKSQKA